MVPPARRLAANPTIARTATASAASPHGRTLLDEGDVDGEGDLDDVVVALGVGVADEDAPAVAAAGETVKPKVSETGCPSSEVTFQSTR
jgi:hypothetical protein